MERLFPRPRNVVIEGRFDPTLRTKENSELKEVLPSGLASIYFVEFPADWG